MLAPPAPKPAEPMPPFDPAEADSYPVVTGVDEAGRGALCGPVVAAAVWFEPTALPPELLAGLDDSKKLAPPRREALAAEIRARCRVAVAARSARAIDREGIVGATMEAMRRAVERLGLDAPIRADGRDTPPGLRAPCEAVIRGDGSVPQIAAASIVAKTTRDALMRRVALRWPHYGWASNKGYGADAHLAALAAHGPCAHHRRSFAPVAALLAPAVDTARTAD